MDRIFDLDARDVRMDFAVSDDDVAGLADVDRRVLDVRGQHAFDEHATAFDRVDAVEPRVVNLQIAEGRVLAAVDGDAVVDVVLDHQVLDREVVARSDHRVGQHVFTVEGRAPIVLFQPADRNVVHVHEQRLVVWSGMDFYRVAGDASVERGLDRFTRVDAHYGRLALL